MNWKDLLKGSIEYNYMVAEKLMAEVDDSALGWKPATGANWMTTGQLLLHITSACGASIKGFVTGDWGCPEGMDPNNMPADAMLPPAEKMPTVKSVAEAKRLLAEDKKLALEMLAQCSEKDLAERPAPAPWDTMQFTLGQRLLQMVDHLQAHKSQLFYYLKLQGKPVNTMHLWGV
ncbi:MAG: DinB family protein [Candidatus Latescibacterota bacterium]|nr:MAG: DinB family protein [Candidatus Latescibacterota bacterium]